METFDRAVFDLHVYSHCNNISRVFVKFFGDLKISNEPTLYAKRLRGEAPAKGLVESGNHG